MLAYDPTENAGPTFPGNAISFINPGGPAQRDDATFVSDCCSDQVPVKSAKERIRRRDRPRRLPVYGPMTYDPKSKFALVGNAGSNTLSYMSIWTERAIQESGDPETTDCQRWGR